MLNTHSGFKSPFRGRADEDVPYDEDQKCESASTLHKTNERTSNESYLSHGLQG